MKPKWERKPCGCIKTDLPRAGKVMVRCTKHRGKPSKRTLAYFDPDGIVKLES